MIPRKQRCKLCGADLTFREELAPHMKDAGGRIYSVPVASGLFECPEHGLWRVWSDGRHERIARARNVEIDKGD